MIAVVLIEGAIAAMLTWPPRAAPLRALARQYYLAFDRNIIQLDPRFARYDPELFYTLRPGRFVFAQREFSTEFRVNSLGVRDDEEALAAPELIVAGDSFAMGWGVGQDETFAKIIARATGLRVLNAAVSSYGTVREMRLLDRANTARLRYLIVQYSANDWPENLQFLARGNTHVPSSEERFRRLAEKYQAKRRYYPGKYSRETLRLLLRGAKSRLHPRVRSAAAAGAPAGDEADVFINAVLHASAVDLHRVRLIVFEINGDGAGGGLIPALRRKIATGSYSPPIGNVTLVDVSAALRPEHFFVLDEHLNRRGHRAIADVLLSALRGLPRDSR